jgi:hypothetical protein
MTNNLIVINNHVSVTRPPDESTDYADLDREQAEAEAILAKAVTPARPSIWSMSMSVKPTGSRSTYSGTLGRRHISPSVRTACVFTCRTCTPAADSCGRREPSHSTALCVMTRVTWVIRDVWAEDY